MKIFLVVFLIVGSIEVVAQSSNPHKKPWNSTARKSDRRPQSSLPQCLDLRYSGERSYQKGELKSRAKQIKKALRAGLVVEIRGSRVKIIEAFISFNNGMTEAYRILAKFQSETGEMIFEPIDFNQLWIDGKHFGPTALCPST